MARPLSIISEKSTYNPNLDAEDINAVHRFLAGNEEPSHDKKLSHDEELSHDDVKSVGENPDVVRRISSRSVLNEVSGQLAIGSLRLHSEVVEEEEDKKEKPTKNNTIQRKANATLVLADFPKHIFLGLDAAAFGRKTTILGISGLPTGAHLLYGGIQPDLYRSGVWFFCGGKEASQVGEFFVRKWNAYDEIIMEEVSQAEIHNKKEEIVGKEESLINYYAKMDGAVTGLGGVNDASSPLNKIWYGMTFALTGEMLTRLTGDEWNCWKVRQLEMHVFNNKYS